MDAEPTLAVVAATCGVAMALAPLLQASRVLKRGQADDVSVGWLVVVAGGATMWALYGISIPNWALIIPNAIATIVSAMTIAVVLRVRSRSGAAAATEGGRAYTVGLDAE